LENCNRKHDKMQINKLELQKLNTRGLIAGPGESEEAFLSRIAYCLKLKETLIPDELIPSKCREDGEKVLERALPLSNKIFNITPDWVPCFITNYKLAPWHGAVAWIFQEKKETPPGAFLQIRRTLPPWYKKEELIAHELAHVGRMQFEERRFEEMLAYESSKRGWQRYLGPLIRAPWESLLFVTLLLCILLLDFLGGASLYYKLLPLKLIPVGLIGLASLRLYLTRRTYAHAKEKLAKILHSSEVALHVLYRLTDNEIVTLAKLPQEKIVDFIEEKKGSEIRWEQIYPYFLR